MNKLLKPTFKTVVRRSCRIAQLQSLGAYQSKVTVRERIRNPKTGRMVYRDGRVGKSIRQAKLAQVIVELNYFEQMKQRLISTPEVPLSRRSQRLKDRNKRAQSIEDGMDTTLEIFKKTIRMLTDTLSA